MTSNNTPTNLFNKRSYQALAYLILSLCFSAISYADESQIRTATLQLSNSTQHIDAILTKSRVNMQINGVITHVQMQQEFKNTSDSWMEGIYLFPLPENAAVNDMRITIGDRVIQSEIKEKKIALQQYQQAAEQGKAASLLSQKRNNLFRTRIANIAPGQQVTIHIQYLQTLYPEADQYSLRFPMTITPRYQPQLSTDDPQQTVTNITDPDIVFPMKATGDPTAPKLSLSLTINSENPLTDIISNTHNIDLAELQDRYMVSLSDGEVAMDRDFEINWSSYPQVTPDATVYRQSVGKTDYAMLVVTPPAVETIDPQPRELIFVLDTSGSMAGNSIRAAKAALLSALDELQTSDRFNIIQFNSTAEQLYNSSQLATEGTISVAKDYISRLNADGGTEMTHALTLALQGSTDPEYLRQVVFITDGSVGNERELIQQLNRQLGDSRLFTVGIGTAPNSYFMRKAAQFGRGSFHMIAEAAHVEREMSTLLRKLRNPALTNLHVEWIGGKAVSQPNPLPDLYADEPIVLSAKLDDTVKGLIIKGQFGHSPWEKHIDLNSDFENANGVAALWARVRIEDLSDHQWISDDDTLHRQEIIDLSIEHRIATQYTSFVALEKETISNPGGLRKKLKIANLQPAGSIYPLPQGATSGQLKLLAGFILMLLASIFYRQDMTGARRENA